MSNDQDLFDVKRQKVAPAQNGAVHRVIALYCQIFAERFRGERPVITPGDGKAIKRLVTEFGEPKILERLPRYLALDDAFLQSEGYPLRLLPGAWNKLTVQAQQRAAKDGAVQKTNDYLKRLRAHG